MEWEGALAWIFVGMPGDFRLDACGSCLEQQFEEDGIFGIWWCGPAVLMTEFFGGLRRLVRVGRLHLEELWGVDGKGCDFGGPFVVD
jgi:hypothetical protein